MTKNTSAAKPVERLYTWNWARKGGFNQAWATSPEEAIAKSKEIWPGNEAAPSSVKVVENIDAYYANFPLMD